MALQESHVIKSCNVCKQKHVGDSEAPLYYGPMGTEYLESGRGFFLNELEMSLVGQNTIK